MKQYDGAREDAFSLEQRGSGSAHSQEDAQPVPDTPLLRRQRRLPHLNQAVVIALLIVILVGASALVALLTYWVGH